MSRAYTSVPLIRWSCGFFLRFLRDYGPEIRPPTSIRPWIFEWTAELHRTTCPRSSSSSSLRGSGNHQKIYSYYKARGSHLPLNHVGSHLPLNEVRWSGFRGECDPRSGANVTPAFAWQAQSFQSLKRICSTLESHIHVLCDVPTAISINFQDTMDAMVYHCYVVTSI